MIPVDAAVWAAARGWVVVKIVPGTKKAAEKWRDLELRSPEEVRKAWGNGRYSVGVLTGPSKLVCDDLDVDGEGNPAGDWELEDLADGRALPRTFTLATPRGGTQLIWQSVNGREFKTCAGQVAPHFDVRGRGGLFVLWEPGQPGRFVTDDRDPEPIPAWLAELHPEPGELIRTVIDIPDARGWLEQYGGGKPCEIMKATCDKWIGAFATGLPHEVMKDAVYALIGDCASGHVGLNAALALVRDAFQKSVRGRTRAVEWQVDWRNSIASAIGKKAARHAPYNEDPCDIEKYMSKELVDMRAQNREDFWNAREELSLIRKWAQSRLVSPMAALGEVLAEVVCHVPPFVQLPPIIGGNGTLNMLIALTGHSGTGKGGAGGLVADAIGFDGDMDMERIPIGSGEGIPKAYGYMHLNKDTRMYELVRTLHSVIIEVKEIDSLSAIKDRGGSTLSAQLCQFYSGEQLGYWWSDITKRVIIPGHMYRGCVVAGVQPGCGGVILNDTDNGFAQRWLWLPSTDSNAPLRAPRTPKQRIKWEIPEDIPAFHPERTEPFIIDVCDKAVNQIRSARLPALRGETDGLESHKLYTRLKVAAALSILDGGVTVEDEDWDLAGYLIRISDSIRRRAEEELRHKAVKAAKYQGHLDAHRAEASGHESERITGDRISNKVISLMSTDGEWTSYGDGIKNKIAARDREALPGILSALVNAGKIETRKSTYRGHQSTQYRLPK